MSEIIDEHKSTMYGTPSIADLVGSTKNESNIQTRPIKIPYNIKSEIKQNESFDMTFGKTGLDDEFLDCRSIYLRFNMKYINNDPNVETPAHIMRTDANGNTHQVTLQNIPGIDGSTIANIFSKIVIKSGSTVITTLEKADLIMNFLTNVYNDNSEGELDQIISGQNHRDPDPSNILLHRNVNNGSGEYMLKPFPRNSLLNCDALIPMSSNRLKENLTVTFYLKSFQQSHSTLRPDSDHDIVFDDGLHSSQVEYVLENVELLCNYLQSPSLSSWFNSNQWQQSVDIYDTFYHNIQTQNNVLKFGSAVKSASKLITILRQSDGGRNLESFATKDKLDKTIEARFLQEFNTYINNRAFYMEPITSNELGKLWKNFKNCYPHVTKSKWFGANYLTDRFVLVQNLNSCPPVFSNKISSGIETRLQNHDMFISLKLKPETFLHGGMHGGPVSLIRADTIMVSDGVIFLTNDGTLRVRN